MVSPVEGMGAVRVDGCYREIGKWPPQQDTPIGRGVGLLETYAAFDVVVVRGKVVDRSVLAAR